MIARLLRIGPQTLLEQIVGQDAMGIALGLGIGHEAPAALQGSFARVVGHHRRADGAIFSKQALQMTHPGAQVDLGIEQLIDALDAIIGGRLRHHLHQADRAHGRNGLRIVTGLGTDERMDQDWIERLSACKTVDHGLDVPLGGNGLLGWTGE